MRPARTARMIPVLIAILCITDIVLANEPPVADAGLPRYAATDPVQLDGSGSYDPDQSGALSYAWTQVSGPSAVIADANTAEPTISGFVQTDEIQECEFELVVGDGELVSPPDTVKVMVVPDFGYRNLQQDNPPFDPDKPTVVYFGGGNCVTGHSMERWDAPAWNSRANLMSFPNAYGPDPGGGGRTYYKYGDLIIVHLSSVAPNYKQPIQAIGFSTGADPAIDVGIHMNRVYRDARYAVNRVTNLDGGCRFNEGWDFYSKFVELFLTSAVDGEQCWFDMYHGSRTHHTRRDDLHVSLGLGHGEVLGWYKNSLTGKDMNTFNNGLVAGAYWSVIGPGKNLQLAPTDAYYFRWDGTTASGSMSVFDEALYPGRLPEPVRLVGPEHGATVDAGGALLSCEESENAVGYRLLLGAHPHHMVYLFSDTPEPPDAVLATFPFQETWWTVQAYDRYGSAIHADPLCIHAASVEPQKVENLTMRRAYASIQQALNDAHPGDEIVIDAGVYHYRENLDFKGKNLTLRSTDPNDPVVVAATVISARPGRAAITMSGCPHGHSVLAGLTIAGGAIGIACRDASPTIRNCTIGGAGATAIEFWRDYEPILIDCTVLGAVEGLNDPTLLAHWALDETKDGIAHDSVGVNHGVVNGEPLWQPAGGRIGGALQFDGTTCITADFVLNPAEGPFSVLTWVQGGAPGQVIVSQEGGANWLMADPATGGLMTELKCGGRCAKLTKALHSDAIITDGAWHGIGVIWDGASRSLYADGVLVAEDTQDGLADSSGGLILGCGKNMTPDTCWTGLIDDVRIYKRAVKP